MKNRVFVAMCARDRNAAAAVWRSLTIPSVTRWISTRDPLDDTTPDAQDMEELARSRLMVLVLSSKAVQGERLTFEIKLARHQRAPIIVVQVGEGVTYNAEWDDLLFTATTMRVSSPPTPEELAVLMEQVRSLLGLDKDSDAQLNPIAVAAQEEAAKGDDESVEVQATLVNPVLASKARVHKRIDPLERAMAGAEEEDPDPQPKRVSSRPRSLDAEPSSSPKRILGLSPLLLAGVGAGIVVVGIIITVLMMRGGDSSGTQPPKAGMTSTGGHTRDSQPASASGTAGPTTKPPTKDDIPWDELRTPSPNVMPDADVTIGSMGQSKNVPQTNVEGDSQASDNPGLAPSPKTGSSSTPSIQAPPKTVDKPATSQPATPGPSSALPDGADPQAHT